MFKIGLFQCEDTLLCACFIIFSMPVMLLIILKLIIINSCGVDRSTQWLMSFCYDLFNCLEFMLS